MLCTKFSIFFAYLDVYYLQGQKDKKFETKEWEFAVIDVSTVLSDNV